MQLFFKSNLMITLLMLILAGTSMNNFLLIWVFMEMSTLVFIFIVSMDQYTLSSLSLKYFITQSFISMVMVITFLLFDGEAIMLKEMILSGLSLWKLGVPPFQNWFMNLIMDASWHVFFLISTVMKVIPFLILSMFFSYMAFTIATLSVLAPSFMGASQICMKKIMGVSSMFTSGWVIFSMISSKSDWLIILLLYSLMLLVFCANVSAESMSTLDNSFGLSSSDSLLMFFVLLSLSGIPPMSGFFMKIYILMSVLSKGYLAISAAIVVMSSFSVYMYIKNTFKYMTLNILSPSYMNFKLNFIGWIIIMNMASAIILYM
uniref:NADH-ubiquinone oxidoreductase chain 2 n=1 Tax=Sinergasilus polycolpus TaxID=232557 RepID=C1ING1_SINPO|nr:NADH dehydrogenase subunit 2 [Sinergasilus polycolpus]ACB99590.1 NADH dehydrogenase subunit 2 [Sinergasilus polycolpus]ALG63362.1 NADH dehydrogenase subunit 2 [Sinergasilus polycolpus]